MSGVIELFLKHSVPKKKKKKKKKKERLFTTASMLRVLGRGCEILDCSIGGKWLRQLPDREE